MKWLDTGLSHQLEPDEQSKKKPSIFQANSMEAKVGIDLSGDWEKVAIFARV